MIGHVTPLILPSSLENTTLVRQISRTNMENTMTLSQLTSLGWSGGCFGVCFYAPGLKSLICPRQIRRSRQSFEASRPRGRRDGTQKSWEFMGPWGPGARFPRKSLGFQGTNWEMRRPHFSGFHPSWNLYVRGWPPNIEVKQGSGTAVPDTVRLLVSCGLVYWFHWLVWSRIKELTIR